MRRIAIFLFFGFFFIPSVWSKDLPSPQGWVNDFAGVISQEYHNRLNALIQEVEEKTSVEIAVVTMSSIAPYDEKDYARLLFDNWKPGKKGKDNGLLILLAIKERLWRIETGYGIEGILPDGLCGEIGRNYMVPYFREGLYGEGLFNGVSQIASVIAKEYGVKFENLALAGPLRYKEVRGSQNTLFMCLFGLFFFSIWGIPWPIYFGLPFAILFALGFAVSSRIAGLCVLLGFFNAMIIRYFIWRSALRYSYPLWRIFIFGLPSHGKSMSRYGSYGSWGGGFGGGGFGGGGFGGGLGGGGGAGGRF